MLLASLLAPNDDVATALCDLAAGTEVALRCGDVARKVRLQQPIALGHKFATRAMSAGLRIRKYGEYIGRLTQDVAAGAWVHDHNLATSAQRDPEHERAWLHPEALPVRTVGEARTTVGENPLFDARTNRLYWIDVRETPAIHAIDLATNTERRWPLHEDVGSIALTQGTQLIAGLRSGFATFDPHTGALASLVDPEADLPGNRMNDGKCDPSGRFWCASMNPESGIAEGSLYVLERDCSHRRVHGGYFTPNGIAWSLDGATMYIADTRRGTIFSFPFDTASATLGSRSTFADLGAMPGGPDGATVDAQGGLWSAQFDGACLIRYTPEGLMDRVVRLPVSKPTSCAFGGPDYSQLYVTTATRGLDAGARASQPLAGRLLVVDVDVRGVPPVRFDMQSSLRKSA